MPQQLFNQTPTLNERLAAKATELRSRALRMVAGSQRDELLRQADRWEQEARMGAYLNSKELEPPT